MADSRVLQWGEILVCGVLCIHLEHNKGWRGVVVHALPLSLLPVYSIDFAWRQLLYIHTHCAHWQKHRHMWGRLFSWWEHNTYRKTNVGIKLIAPIIWKLSVVFLARKVWLHCHKGVWQCRFLCDYSRIAVYRHRTWELWSDVILFPVPSWSVYYTVLCGRHNGLIPSLSHLWCLVDFLWDPQPSSAGCLEREEKK